MGILKIEGALKNWEREKFVNVLDDATGRTYYGGHQRWLLEEGISKFFSDRSCGITAVTNILIYMAQNNSEKANLIDKTVDNQWFANKKGIIKADYSAFQKRIYNNILPAVWGIPTINTLAFRVQKFALERGVTLKTIKYYGIWSEESVKAFIIKGLNHDSPVLLLTWNSEIPDLKLHWVTVTCLFESETGTKMVTSNWGNMQSFDFSKWVNDRSLHRGLVYFE